ncbi:MAG: methyltransferase dimerization domain-containing protein [Candidatus Methanomethylophilaceae archaeon]
MTNAKDPENLFRKPDSDIAPFRERMSAMYDSYRELNLLLSAFDHGLFELLKDPHTADEVSANYGSDPILTEMMCRALESRGYLTMDGDRYIDSPMARTFLTEDSDFTMCNRVRQEESFILPWGDVWERIVNGPEVLRYEDMFSDLWISAIGDDRRVEGVSKVLDIVDSKIDMCNVSKVLEIGAGHAYHLIGLCHRHPWIEAHVFDKPEIIDTTLENTGAYGIKVECQTGDYYDDDIKGFYDLVMIGFNPAGSDVKLCERVASTVGLGGYLLIRRHNTQLKTDPLRNMDRNIRMWDGMERGSTLSWGDIRDMSRGYNERMEEIGLEKVMWMQLDRDSEMLLFRRVRNA